MIQITRSRLGTGFDIRFSDKQSGMMAYTVNATSVLEVQTAIAHHYASGHQRGIACPLCRLMDKEEKEKERERKGE